MNDYDRSNLSFLLSLKTPEDWLNWADCIDADDLVYALELVQTAIAENMVEQMEWEEAAQDEDLDLTQAQAVLTKFSK